MTDNEIVGEQIKAKQETLAWRNAYKTKFEQDEPFTDLDLSAWLAIQDVLAIPSIPDIGTVTGIEDAINHGRNLALAEVNQAITNRIGGK